MSFKIEILSRELVKANGKEYLTIELKRKESQTPLLFAFDPEDETYLLYSDNLKEWVVITPEQEYYQPYIEFIKTQVAMTIAR
ncbi:MAG: hypothetical protein BAJALOKI2v1_200062 [Promethearchaeota archaeon]|nr:MAG: hypothetical protein BAJALOKI2v1_200062 [Candidatus Lokiarchaeota archaeon]